MIEFKNVSMKYKTNGVIALDDVSVTIEAGEFVFVVGASGAGKSSFLSAIMGQEHIDSGEITVGDFKLNKIKKRDLPYLRRKLGIVFQDFRLIPKMSVYDNVAFALRVIGMNEKRVQKRVHYVLKLVGLSDKEKMLPHQLSTGERQRVAIARALVNNPSVIIADEPTGNLDPVLSNDIMEMFDRINALGATVIVVTHDLELVHQFDHRIVTLEKGRLVSDIPSSSFMAMNAASPEYPVPLENGEESVVDEPAEVEPETGGYAASPSFAEVDMSSLRLDEIHPVYAAQAYADPRAAYPPAPSYYGAPVAPPIPEPPVSYADAEVSASEAPSFEPVSYADIDISGLGAEDEPSGESDDEADDDYGVLDSEQMHRLLQAADDDVDFHAYLEDDGATQDTAGGDAQ